MQSPGFADLRLLLRLVLAWRVELQGLGLNLRWVCDWQITPLGRDAARLAPSLLSQLAPWLRVLFRQVLELTVPLFPVSTSFDFGTCPVKWLRLLPKGVGSALLLSCCATLLDSARTLSSTCTTSLLYTEGGTWLSSFGLSLEGDEHSMAVIGVEPAVKNSFVLKGMQTRRKGQYNAEMTLSPRLYVKPLITPITAIREADWPKVQHWAWSQNWHFNIFLQVSQGATIMAISTSSTTSDNSPQDKVPFPTVLRKADLNTPMNLSNWPPNHGARLRLNLQDRSSCARQLWNFSSFLTLFSQSAADLNALPLSE